MFLFYFILFYFLFTIFTMIYWHSGQNLKCSSINIVVYNKIVEFCKCRVIFNQFTIFFTLTEHENYTFIIHQLLSIYLCLCKQEIPGSQVYGQTVTTDHHNELIQMGINPSLKWTEATHKFPNVIYCAPPSRTPDYAGNIR